MTKLQHVDAEATARTSTDIDTPQDLFRRFGLRAMAIGAPKALNAASIVILNLCLLPFLHPAQFGIFAFALSFVLIVDGLANAAIDVTTLRRAGLDRKSLDVPFDTLEVSALGIKLFAWLAVLLLGASLSVVAGVRFLKPFGTPLAFGVTVIAGAALALFRTVQLHFQISRRSGAQGAIDLVQTLFRATSISLLLTLGSASPVRLLLAYAFSSAVASAVFVRLMHRRPGSIQWNTCGRRARSILRDAGPVLATFGVGAVAARMDLLSLAFFSHSTQVGIFGAAYNVAFLPEMAGTYLAAVFSPYIISSCRDGRFHGLYVRFQVAALLVAALLLASGLLFLGPVAGALLPARYAQSVPVMRVLLAPALIGLITYPLTFHFLVFFAPGVLLRTDALLAPVLIVAYYFAARSDNVAAVAWITCLSRLAKFVVIQAYAFRLSRRIGARHSTLPSAAEAHQTAEVETAGGGPT